MTMKHPNHTSWQQAMHSALANLAKTDDALDTKIKAYGYPADRSLPQGYQTLARIIIGQQISRAVASHIWEKLGQAGWQDADAIAECSVAELKECGLSGRKAEYLIGAAQACLSGALRFADLPEMSGDDASAHLVALRGVGAWTADNYRLFALGDMDAWPGNDLALQEAMRRLRQLQDRPDHKMMDRLASQWAPYRGAGALMLWHIYAHEVRLATPSAI